MLSSVTTGLGHAAVVAGLPGMIDVGPRPITSEVDFFGSIMDPSVTVIPAEGASIRVKI